MAKKVSPAPASVVADPAFWAVETTMYRALAVLRFIVLLNTLLLGVLKLDDMTRPGIAVAALVVMVLWTGFATWAYDSPHRRESPLLVGDLVIGVSLVLLTPVVQGGTSTDITTLPSFWVMAVVLAWGVHWNWAGGLIASAAVAAADIVIRHGLNERNVGNLFLLMIGGPLLGYSAMLLKEMAAARDRAERAAAVAAERARLARVVHDGVLQVLSLVQRRGLELGGEAAALGRLAGEQEVALRSFVQQDNGSTTLGSSGDLVRALSALQSSNVTVSVPGSPVLFPAAVVEEIVAVVRACLDNVRRHVATDAPTWVLLEDVPGSAVVTVRDEGPGIASGRLAEAEAQGRLGVTQSIRGRIRDLGGTTRLVTAPGQGVEWELVVPTVEPTSATTRWLT